MKRSFPGSDMEGRTRAPRRALRATLVVALSVVITALCLPETAQAQDARVFGRVTDAQTGQGLPGAQVVVEGTQRGTLSGADGRFMITALEGGQVNLVVSYLGYDEGRVAGVSVGSEGASALEIALTPAAVAIEGVTITVAGQRGTISRALEDQRNAAGVISAITSEQMSRSPDGNAAAAVQRLSGVSVQDGKHVSVRGLGERYTTTSLNGRRIPSPDPEKKVVPLDLFPSGLLQSITTSKTFTPNLSGDFSGGQVDIRTREFPAQRQVTYSYSAGFTQGVTGRTMLAAPSAGGEWLAFGSEPRQVPGVLDRPGLLENAGQSDFNDIVRSFRNRWGVASETAMPAGSFSMSMGGTDPLFGRPIGYLASATYSIDQSARRELVRAIALPGPGGEAVEASRYEGTLGRTSVLWGGLLNLGTTFGDDHRVSMIASYNRSADNDGRRERGVNESTGADIRIDRLQYVERGVFSGQLQGEHSVGLRQSFDWSLAASSVTRREPDRSEVVYLIDRNASGEELPPAWALTGNEVAVRTFADLRESALEATANHRISFGSDTRPLELRFGASARRTERDADNRAWSVQSIGSNPLTRDRSLREKAPEEIFGDAFTSPGDSVFSVVPIAQGGSYRAEDQLLAGYGMVEWSVTPGVQLITGARIERSDLELDAISTLRQEYHAEPGYTDLLPALALNLDLTDRQSLRFSLSRTVARPEYREIAPVQYREVIGGENTRGNAELRRTLISNADVRWEFYPERDELLSIALFAKSFDDPIERISLATSGTVINTFVNAAGAQNYGLELEARKGLGFLGDRFEPLGVFANATLMRSEIEIGNEGLASTTNPSRPMLGQAPYVLNAGISYADLTGDTSATLLYNVVGERIVAAAGAPLPDVYEKPRPSLDLSLRFPLSATLSAKIDASNLLDAPHLIEQGDVTREQYRTGRSLSVGVTLRR